MRYQKIESLIQSNISDLSLLEIVDESHLHAGRQGQESHFKVLVVSSSFNGQSRVQRQRKVQQLLSDEFSQGLHALSMRLLTPDEYEKQKNSFETPNCQGAKPN